MCKKSAAGVSRILQISVPPQNVSRSISKVFVPKNMGEVLNGLTTLIGRTHSSRISNHFIKSAANTLDSLRIYTVFGYFLGHLSFRLRFPLQSGAKMEWIAGDNSSPQRTQSPRLSLSRQLISSVVRFSVLWMGVLWGACKLHQY